MEKILTIKKFYLLIFLISTISLLGAVFIESFIFPIPPDVVIIPMTIAKEKSGLKLR